MGKIGITDVKPDVSKLANLPDAFASVSPFSPSGIKQFKDIIDSIRAMVKEAKELQNPAITERTEEALKTTDGITKAQLMGFARSFLDNLITQGYGDKNLSQTLGDIPLTIKQIRGLL